MLSEKRSSEYDSWFTIGTIFYHVSNGSEKGIEEFIDFSKRTDTFSEEYCSNKWSSMKQFPYSIRVLITFVKQDNMDEFIQCKRRLSKKKLLHTISLYQTDIPEYQIAESLHMLCMDEFVYNDEGWFHDVEGQWVKTKHAMELKKSIQQLKGFLQEENKILKNKRSDVKNKVRDLEEIDVQDRTDEWKVYLETVQKELVTLDHKVTTCTTVQLQLDKTAFKNGILLECKELFYDSHVVVKKESNINTKHDHPDNYMKMLHTTNDIDTTDECYEQMKDKKWIKSDTTWKRIRDIINDFGLDKSNATARRLYKYFLNKNVQIYKDDKHGHKIFIQY